MSKSSWDYIELAKGKTVKYRSKITVQAVQLSALNRDAVAFRNKDKCWFYGSNGESELYVQTENGTKVCSDGDWLAKDSDGYLEVWSNQEFIDQFEEISE